MEEMKDFMDQIDASMERIQPGDLLEGKVMSIQEDAVVVNIGYISDGIIPRSDFTKDRNASLTDFVELDATIQVIVVDVKESEGVVFLSATKAAQQVAWHDFGQSLEHGKALMVEVTEAVKGGVSAVYKGVRGFIPASRLAARSVGDLTTMVGKSLAVRVIELDQAKNKVVFSGRELAEAQQAVVKDALMGTLVEGEKRTGTVTRLMDFGAFVDIGGVEGLIHISDLSYERIKHPSEVLRLGDVVEVQVQKIDIPKNRISLSLKAVQNDPWIGAADYYEPGDIIEGTVVRLMPFGAFVEVEPGVEGLVHISEISSERINRPQDAVQVGQTMDVMVLKVEEAERRMSLSIRQAKEEEGSDYELPESEGEAVTSLGALFAAKLGQVK